MLNTKQLTGFLREKDKHKININCLETGIYMSLLNQGPSTSEPNYKDVSIDVPKIARSANRKNTAIIEIMEKFKKMGVITDMKETGKDSYRVSFKNLE